MKGGQDEMDIDSPKAQELETPEEVEKKLKKREEIEMNIIKKYKGVQTERRYNDLREQNNDLCKLSYMTPLKFENVNVYTTNVISTGGFGCVYLLRDVYNNMFILKEVPLNDTETKAKEILEKKFGNNYPPFLMRYSSVKIGPVKSWLVIEPFLDESTGTIATSLQDLLDNNYDYSKGGWSVTYIHTIFKNILNAVDFLHINGLVHNDLKPSNILCKKNGEIQIIDFGTICVDNENYNCSSVWTKYYANKKLRKQGIYFIGDEEYVRYHPYSDISALIVILLELLTKLKPVMDSDLQIAKKKLEDILEIKIDRQYTYNMEFLDNWVFKEKSGQVFDIFENYSRKKIINKYSEYIKNNKQEVTFEYLLMNLMYLRIYLPLFYVKKTF